MVIEYKSPHEKSGKDHDERIRSAHFALVFGLVVKHWLLQITAADDI